MPRSARILPESGVFHVITRGNNRMDVFHESEDYGKYLEILEALQLQHPFLLYHYCLMTNHVHLLLEIREASSLSQVMKKLNLTYALYYKKKYRYIGHFWQDRFKSLLIEKDLYLLACGAYIELNPVKAGLVQDPAQYPYSSHSFYAAHDPRAFLTPNPLYGQFGDAESTREANYKAFVLSRLEDYDDYTKNLITRRAIGSESFLSALETQFQILIAKRGRGRPRNVLETLGK